MTSSISPLALGGLSSGLDTQALIDRLIAIEGAQLSPLRSRASVLDRRISALGDLRDLARALASQLDTLTGGAVRARSAATDTPSGTLAYLLASASSDALPGSFKVLIDQLATRTRRLSQSPVGSPVSAAVALASAGFIITPTTGTFSVNGHLVTIDASTVLSNGADLAGANTVIAKIRDATATDAAPVTVALVADVNGVAGNALQLSSNAAITLGAGNDTSNFLAASGLSASANAGAGPFTRTSVRPIGGTLASVALDSARIAGLTSTASGKLRINGIDIGYDTTVDSLAAVVARINASGAGVLASYDAVADKITLQAQATGATSLAVSDTSGDLLAKLGVTAGASETLGVNAKYEVDTGSGYAVRWSTSNTVGDAVSGVTLQLERLTGATPVTVTVSTDADRIVGAVKDLVSAYNKAYAKVRELTGRDGLLQGDASLNGIAGRLRDLIDENALGLTGSYTALWQVGLTFGAAGAAVGTTNTLQLDETKLRAALAADPQAVARLFDGHRSSTALKPGGTSSLSGASGDALSAVSGTYRVVDNGSGLLTAFFTPAGGIEETISRSGSIVANGTNASLIPGVTLRAGAALQAGTSYVQVTALERGAGVDLFNYVTALSQSGGLLGGRIDNETETKKTLTDQIATATKRLDQERATLLQKFARLESTLAKLQSVQSLLNQQLLLLGTSSLPGGSARPTLGGGGA